MAVLNEILHFFVNFTTHLVLFSLPFILQYRLRRKRLWLFVPGAAAYLLVPYLFKLLSGRSFYSNPIFKIGWYSASYLILCAALALFWNPLWAALILLAYYVLIGFSLSRFVTASYTNAVFDRFLNPRIAGAKVNQGLWEREPEDDDEETETDQQNSNE